MFTKLKLFLFSSMIGFALAATAGARGGMDRAAQPVNQDDGNEPQPFSVVIGTQNAIRLFVPLQDRDRAVLIQNPSASHPLMVSSWSGFTSTHAWWFVPPSSGSYSDFTSGASYYVLYPPGTSSETVRGAVGRNAY